MQSDTIDFYETQTVYQAVACCPGGSRIHVFFEKKIERIGKTEMGLWLEQSSVFPFLTIGVTFNSFHFSGNDLVLMLRLQI